MIILLIKRNLRPVLVPPQRTPARPPTFAGVRSMSPATPEIHKSPNARNIVMKATGRAFLTTNIYSPPEGICLPCGVCELPVALAPVRTSTVPNIYLKPGGVCLNLKALSLCLL